MNKKHVVIKYVVYIIVMAIMSRAKLFGLNPFATGWILALTFLGENFFVLMPVYFLTVVLSDSQVSLIGGAFCSLVLFIYAVVRRYKDTNAIKVAVALISQGGYMYAMIVNHRYFTSVVLTMFFSLVTAYLAIGFLRPIVIGKLRYCLTDVQIISGGMLLCAAALGLARTELFGFPTAAAVMTLLTLVSGYVYGAKSVIVGICFGIGYALMDYRPEFIALFSLTATVTACFVPLPRIFGACSAIIGMVMTIFLFDLRISLYPWMIASAFGGLLYLLLPVRWLDRLRDILATTSHELAARFMVSTSRQAVGRDLSSLSEVFHEMSSVMGGMEGALSPEHAQILTDKIVNGLCRECKYFNTCNERGVIDKLCDVVRSAVDGGKLTIADMPEQITQNCNCIAALMSAANDAANEYRDSRRRVDSENYARKVVAQQLGGVSNILSDMARKVNLKLDIDERSERRIMDELTYRDYVCSECMVTSDGVVTLVVDQSADDTTVTQAVSSVLGRRMCVISSECGALQGSKVYRLDVAPKYEAVFGVSGCPKRQGELSGDTHSFVKLTRSKFLMALCDGMGSGEQAERFSSNTLSLIENFYKAGFEHELVLDSVNRFLSVTGDEIYSALDVCVIDLDTGETEVIKIGSPPSYLRSKTDITRIDGSCLPMGVLEEMRPTVTAFSMNTGDMLVFTSDGVSDNYPGDGLANVINSMSAVSPSMTADGVIDATLRANGGVANDDMTVTCVRLMSKV